MNEADEMLPNKFAAQISPMHTFLPTAPLATFAQGGTLPATTWVAPALLSERDYARVRSALPAGMPDYLEVCVSRQEDGIERTTSAVYGRHTYLLHYSMEPTHG